ncbi:MAG: hypothetical protein NC131_06160 [Roseburia sp.]|nr:hypothetical protein [Roseburia sp.]
MKEKITPVGGVVPTPEDQDKLEEFVTWLRENNYEGFICLHKKHTDLGITWMNGTAETLSTNLINSIKGMSQSNQPGSILALLLAFREVLDTVIQN